MKEHFFEKLESLRRQLIGMGAEVENQIRLAVEALVESDATKARKVIEIQGNVSGAGPLEGLMRVPG